MFSLVGNAGPWAVPLAVLTVLLSVLIVRSFFEVQANNHSKSEAMDRRAAILFYGFLAAVLGFLGQCAALYRIMSTVQAADALVPERLAEGFAASFITTLWGGGLLLVAGLVWIPLRWMSLRRPSAGLIALFLLVGTVGCSSASSQAPEDITQGVWAGDGGPDTFLFDLRGTAPDSMFGSVFVLHGGKLTSELTIDRASYHPPNLEMFISKTNATYRGEVDISRGRISGGLGFGGEPGPDMELRWTDPSGLPGFLGLPGNEPYTYRKPAGAPDGWQTAEPEDVGLDRSAIEAMVNAVSQGEGGLIQSLVVVRDGRLVVDEYFHGFGPDDLHRVASTTKSVSSLLVGAAMDRGLIAGVDEPITELLGQDADPSWAGETLEHLLTMSMGLDWSASEANNVHGTGPAFFQEVLGRKVVSAPGTKWDYVNANVNLLAGVIFNATGQSADRFVGEALFSPLGIDTFDWAYGREGTYNLMDGSLQLRPRDMAKIGAMVAAGGRWNGNQVISEEWITESTRTHLPTGELPALGGYGYLWWTGELPTGRGPQPIIVANGWGSQFIIIFPQLDMVVVTTGGNEDNGRHIDVGTVLASTLLASM
jgi:CubicO group peptidase (beta-lactamase class C family)